MDNDNKKIKKIGLLTFGFVLVILGLLILLQTFFPFELVRYTLVLWPLVFIFLGIEILYYSNKENIVIKYSFSSFIFIFFTLLFASIFSIGNYAVNKLLYNPDIQNAITTSYNARQYVFDIHKATKIVNSSEKQVNISIPRTTSETENEKAYIHANVSKSNENIIISQMFAPSIYDSFISTDDLLIIDNLPDYIDSLDITIISKVPETITYENCNIL